MSHNPGDQPSQPSQPVSRRTVVRASAHAAWAVPAVIAVSAAPAFAASGPAALSAAVGSATRSGGGLGGSYRIAVVGTISNANTQASTALTIDVTVALGATGWGNAPSVTAPGFGTANFPTTGNTRTATITSTSQIPANASAVAFNATITTGDIVFPPNGTVQITPKPGGSGTFSASNARTIA